MILFGATPEVMSDSGSVAVTLTNRHYDRQYWKPILSMLSWVAERKMGTYAHSGPSGSPLLGEHPIEEFLNRIVRDSNVRTMLEENFGTKTSGIIDLLVANAEDPPKSTWEAFDLIRDFLHNEGETFSEWSAHGDFGEFPITVRGLGGVYFVQAPEFDNAGYFASVADAEAYISFNWDGASKQRAPKS